MIGSFLLWSVPVPGAVSSFFEGNFYLAKASNMPCLWMLAEVRKQQSWQERRVSRGPQRGIGMSSCLTCLIKNGTRCFFVRFSIAERIHLHITCDAVWSITESVLACFAPVHIELVLAKIRCL